MKKTIFVLSIIGGAVPTLEDRSFVGTACSGFGSCYLLLKTLVETLYPSEDGFHSIDGLINPVPYLKAVLLWLRKIVEKIPFRTVTSYTGPPRRVIGFV